ncbi:MAG: WYL domain-containing protein [Desulfosoma sp.]
MEETKRTARILEIVQLVTRRPRYFRRADLARRFEVSERMIQKDVEMIRHGLKLPLENARQGYYFQTLPQLPTTVFSFSEALALLTAIRTVRAIPGVDSTQLAAAVKRLELLFPDEMRRLLGDPTIKPPDRADKTHRQQMLALLHRAWIEGRQLRIVYATSSRGAKPTERIIEPYNILPYGRSWQLVAFDHYRDEVLVFKVDRVQEAHLLETRYTVPDDFDIDAYLGDAWGIMRGVAGPTERVELLFEPEAGRWVAEEHWHKSQQCETLPDGRVRVTFLVGVTPEMVGWLLSYGARVQVLEPAWLRERVAEEHRRAADSFGAGQSNLEQEV